MKLGNLFWLIPDLDAAAVFYDQLFEQPGRRHARRLSYELHGVSFQFYALAPEEAQSYGLSGGPTQQAPRQGVTLVRERWEERLRRLELAGGRWLTPWGPAPWGGHMAHLLDPFGYCWELSSRASSTSAPPRQHS